MFFQLDETVGLFLDFYVMEYSVDLLHVRRRARAFLLHSSLILLRPRELQMAVGLRCCRCTLVLDSVALLQCHEASCYETPPPRKRIRRWKVSLRCRKMSYRGKSFSVISLPRKRTRRWCIPLTCSVSSSVPLVPRADAHYPRIPLSREPLARRCTEREAHERYEHQMIAFFRLSGGFTDYMKQEPW